MNAERIVSITKEARRIFGICAGSRVGGGGDNSAAAFRLDDDDDYLELICDDIDDDFIDLLAAAEVNAGYPAIAIANMALRNILPANHVCGIKYFRNRNSSIKV
jgi:hypothetical protein